MSAQDVALSDEIDKLRAVTASTNDPRLTAILLAVTDERVQDSLTHRIAEGHEYTGTLITFQNGSVDVVFTFVRGRGRFGLVPVSILATVEPAEQRVLRVVEHYLNDDNWGRPQLGRRQPEIDLNMFMVERPRDEGLAASIANGPNSYWV